MTAKQNGHTTEQPRILVVHSMGVALEARGIDDPGPYFDVTQRCLWCGASLGERRIDARTITPEGIDLASEIDSDAAARHLDQHLKESGL